MDTETMVDIEKKLERLAELESKVEKIKVSNRQRVSNYMAKKKKAGMIQVSALISQKAFEVINNRRDKSILAGRQPETAGSIIEQALLFMDSSFKDSVNINDIEMQEPAETPPEQAALPEQINLFNAPAETIEQQAAEPPAPETLSTVQVEPQAEIKAEPAPETQPQATFLDITTMPEKTMDITGFKTWLYTQIKALKAGGYSCTKIAIALNEAGVKTVKDKEFNNKNVERFFNRG